MTKEKERKMFFKLYSDLISFKPNPKKLWILGQYTEYETIYALYEDGSIWAAQQHELSGYKYTNISEVKQ